MRVLIFLFLSPWFLGTVLAEGPDNRSVIVFGEGEVRSIPDMVSVHLQVRSKGKIAQEAQSKNAVAMAKLQKILKETHKIQSKEIQTAAYSVQPEYQYGQNGKQIFLGYVVDHNLIFQTRNLDSIGSVLDTILSGGGENPSVFLLHLAFGLSKRKELELVALEKAMDDSFLRAEAMAKQAKKKVKGLLRASESGASLPDSPQYAAKAGALMESGRTPVAPGEVTVSARISAEYEIQ